MESLDFMLHKKPSTSIHHPNHPFLPNIQHITSQNIYSKFSSFCSHKGVVNYTQKSVFPNDVPFSMYEWVIHVFLIVMLSLVKEEFYLLNCTTNWEQYNNTRIFLTHFFSSSSSEIIQCGPIIYKKIRRKKQKRERERERVR